MSGITGLFRYYCYLSDDAYKFQPVLDRLKAAEYQYLAPENAIKEQSRGRQGNFFYELEQQKTKILVLQMLGEELSVPDSLVSLADIEAKGLAQDELLGQTSVVLSTKLSWADLIDSVQSLSNRRIENFLHIQAGQLARFVPAAHHVYYACLPDNYDRNSARLLSYSLPLIEARYIETRMISNLLRDRSRIIEQERAELDRKLSQILHTHMVKEQSGLKLVEELEEQIQELSSAYGMIAGNSSMVGEGRSRLEGSLKSFMSQLRTEPALKLDQDTVEIISSPFLNRLKSMAALNEMLKNSRDSHQAAIDVVRSRIDIMNSRANISTQEKIRDLMELNTSIQKQSLVFQFAAGLIEFIVLAYYSHSLWKSLAYNAYNNVPSMVQLIMVMLFSGLTTYLTHIVAEYLQGDTHAKKKIFLAGIPLFLLLLVVLIGTVLLGGGTH
ncbi:hypothetical protein ASZ90_017541 [hydrocarbon metagenome]|uniref:Uncharacterized protein n=1 Tax=hydrocarbon metagenome TaxID=938273 RepID=A0A0W8E959_9ZZZZ